MSNPSDFTDFEFPAGTNKPSDPFTFDTLKAHLAQMGTGDLGKQDYPDGLLAIRGVNDVLKNNPARLEEVIELLSPQLSRATPWITEQLWSTVLYGMEPHPEDIKARAKRRFLTLSVQGREPDEATHLVTRMAIGNAGNYELVESLLPCLNFLDNHLGEAGARKAARHLGHWAIRKVLGLGHEYAADGSREIMDLLLGYSDLTTPLLPSDSDEVAMPWELAVADSLMEFDEYGYASDDDQNRWLIGRLVEAGLDSTCLATEVMRWGGEDFAGNDNTERQTEVMGWVLAHDVDIRAVFAELDQPRKDLLIKHPKVARELLTDLVDRTDPARPRLGKRHF